MCENPVVYFLVSDYFKTQEMRNDAVYVNPWSLYDVPDYHKKQKMCDDVVQRDSYSLQFVPHWFFTQEQLEIWHDGNDDCTDDEIIEWYKRYEKRKTQNASIKKS